MKSDFASDQIIAADALLASPARRLNGSLALPNATAPRLDCESFRIALVSAILWTCRVT